jgi:hypothetical protein
MCLEVEARRRDLESNQAVAHIFQLIMALAALILSLGLCVFLILLGRGQLLSAQSRSKSNADQWRAELIRVARANEVLSRKAQLALWPVLPSVTAGNGRYPKRYTELS